MKPQDMLKKTKHMAKAMDAMASRSVDVGLPQEEASGVVYGDGTTVIQVGIWHEFGFGNVPQRSFLRAPFKMFAGDLSAFIGKQWDSVVGGGDPDRALGLIGAKATNISKGAFDSGGYGQWPDISQATKDRKGSSRILWNTGTLNNSITWVVN